MRAGRTWRRPARPGGRGLADVDLARDAAQHAEERQQQFLLALAVEAAEADDLALADGQDDAVEAVSQARPSTVSSGGRGVRRGFRRELRLDVAADHQADDLGVRALALGEGLDVAAVAEDRERVAERLDLVHAVRDEERRDALGLQLGQEIIDGLDVARGQGRGRLVEDQHLRVAAERLGDLDHLAARQRQVADQRARVDVLAAHAGEQRLGARPPGPGGRSGRSGAAGRRSRCCRRPTGRGSATVPGRCRRCPRASAAEGLEKRTGWPCRRISPASGRTHARDDLDQRRLAGAVLAEHGVDRAALGRRSRRPPGRGCRQRTSRCRVSSTIGVLVMSCLVQEVAAPAGSAGGRRQLQFTSASDCAMMAGPEMFTPQGGNSLTVKKLSGRSDQKFSPSFSVV